MMPKVRKEKLSREYIFHHALKFIDSQGLDSLSFRTLGKELGVSQTAFYRHVPDKTALLNGVADSIWQEIFIELNSLLDTLSSQKRAHEWQDMARVYGQGLYAVLHRHPHATILVLTRPMNTINQYTWAAQAISRTQQMKIRLPKNTLSLLNILSTFVAGFVAAEITPTQGDDKSFTREELDKVLQQTDAPTQEVLTSLLAPMNSNDWTFSQQFNEGLDALINGWQAP